ELLESIGSNYARFLPSIAKLRLQLTDTSLISNLPVSSEVWNHIAVLRWCFVSNNNFANSSTSAASRDAVTITSDDVEALIEMKLPFTNIGLASEYVLKIMFALDGPEGLLYSQVSLRNYLLQSARPESLLLTIGNE